MSTRTDHPLVVDWLARLDAAAVRAGVPAGRRAELAAELRAHLADSLPDGPDAADDAAVRTVLDRLGEPDDVVAAEVADAAPALPSVTPPGESPWGVLEVVAVLVLGLSGLVVPFLGPLLGLVLVHRSTAWTRRTRRVATVVALGPILVAPLYWGVAVAVDRSTGGGGVGLQADDTFWQTTALLPHPAEALFLAVALQPFAAAAAAALLALRIRRSPEPGLAGRTFSG